MRWRLNRPSLMAVPLVKMMEFLTGTNSAGADKLSLKLGQAPHSLYSL